MWERTVFDAVFNLVGAVRDKKTTLADVEGCGATLLAAHAESEAVAPPPFPDLPRNSTLRKRRT